ncbi:unnamed protein product [Cunninghamella blakesleeana]
MRVTMDSTMNDFIKTTSSPSSTLTNNHTNHTNNNNNGMPLTVNHQHQHHYDTLNFDTAYWNINENELDMAKLFDTSLWSIDTTATTTATTNSSSSNLTSPTDLIFDLSLKQNHYPSQLTHPPYIPQSQSQQQQRWIQSLPTPIYHPQNNISTSQPIYHHHSPSQQNNTMLPPSPPIESTSPSTIPSPITTNTTCSSSSPMNHSHQHYMVHPIQAPIPLSFNQPFQQQPMIMTTSFHPSSNSSSSSSPISSSLSPHQSHSTTPLINHSHSSILQQQPKNKTMRRQSDQSSYRNHHSHSKNNTTVRRRASSVASVVSLTAHEPIAHVINGIEHITFLYSHDRLVKEYTVRTDVHHIDLEIIPMEFRLQNAIYPRANVDKEEYDGNRWNYETSCNELGWKLCWLNREQLFGKRGLIQRAVDSYRNRHAELRSRRVTRQEKVANGTLRKRRTKKALSAPYF